MRIGINKPVTVAEETSQLNKHFFLFTQPENMLHNDTLHRKRAMNKSQPSN